MSLGLRHPNPRPTRPAGIRSLLALAVLCALSLPPIAGAEPPAVSWTTVDADGRLAAPEGHAWVKWAAASERPVEVYLFERRSPGDEEPTVRRIADTATFIAGLPEGTTEVRVRALTDGTAGPWSEKLRVEVSYPSTSLVRFLAALGSALLVATVALVVTGHRRFRAATEAAAEISTDEVHADG